MSERIRGRKLQERNAVYLSMHPMCERCKNKAAREVDHVIALVNGGTDTDDNLQGLCIDCHKIKTAKDMGYKTKPSFDRMGNPIGVHHWNQ